jgi:hypothetical protein
MIAHSPCAVTAHHVYFQVQQGSYPAYKPLVYRSTMHCTVPGRATYGQRFSPHGTEGTLESQSKEAGHYPPAGDQSLS